MLLGLKPGIRVCSNNRPSLRRLFSDRYHDHHNTEGHGAGGEIRVSDIPLLQLSPMGSAFHAAAQQAGHPSNPDQNSLAPTQHSQDGVQTYQCFVDDTAGNRRVTASRAFIGPLLGGEETQGTNDPTHGLVLRSNCAVEAILFEPTRLATSTNSSGSGSRSSDGGSSAGSNSTSTSTNSNSSGSSTATTTIVRTADNVNTLRANGVRYVDTTSGQVVEARAKRELILSASNRIFLTSAIFGAHRLIKGARILHCARVV
jgi:choline dehydrogenase-like flavoprotein